MPPPVPPSVRRTDDDRQTDLTGEINRILNRVNNLEAMIGSPIFHGVLEHLAVLCLCDGGRISAEQLYAHFIKETVLAQLHGEVQTGLTAEVGQQGVRMFFDDLLHGLDRHRLDVDLVCHGLVGHDGRRVGVYQNDLQTLPRAVRGTPACLHSRTRQPDR